MLLFWCLSGPIVAWRLLRSAIPDNEGRGMDIGVFIPINNNGWIISAASPQYMPSFELNKQVVLKAEAYGLDFALSMIKLHGFGGKTEFWDHGLESFTLMAGRPSFRRALRLEHGVRAGDAGLWSEGHSDF